MKKRDTKGDAGLQLKIASSQQWIIIEIRSSSAGSSQFISS
jgi:hypothetical protein